MPQNIKSSKRIVFKFGTNVLRDDDGEISLSRIYSFVEDISKLAKKGKEVIIVTSGAVGLGAKKLKVNHRESLAVKQACAAVGQGQLMAIYEDGFEKFSITVAQILLTEDDFSQRSRYLSLRNTLSKLLELGVIPIINQNDAISTEELECYQEEKKVCFSDNDKLSALVASKLDADLLIIVSDIDGLYNDNPKINKEARLLKRVEKVDKKIEKMASGVSDGGRGGMATKLAAAKVVTRSGIAAMIVNGKEPQIIRKIFNGEDVGTLFLPSENLSSKKHWIAYATNVIGELVVNKRAKKAIVENETSLLPIGVIEVRNDFTRGDVVSILDEEGNEFARGMINYNCKDCKKIMGEHSDKIMEILGYKNHSVLISKDNLVIL